MKESTKEEQRLLISLGIVAAAVTSATIHLPGGSLFALAQVALFFSATLAFLYIIFSAAELKYENQDDINWLLVNNQLRKASFNYSINSFGFFSIFFLAYALSRLLKHLGVNSHYYRWGLIITLILLLAYQGLLLRFKKSRGL
jgi:hypothetical protein